MCGTGGNVVLDMRAADGSKSSQLLEFVAAKPTGAASKHHKQERYLLTIIRNTNYQHAMALVHARQ